MLTKFNARFKEVKDERIQESLMYEKEMDLIQKINKRLQAEASKAQNELNMAKQALAVPRLHYKNIEKLDLDSLKMQYNEI